MTHENNMKTRTSNREDTMSKQSKEGYTHNEYRDNRLWNGYDYTNQAWALNGVYVNCGHPEDMGCNCYGRKHQGEPTTDK